jgi:hypothetical protein
MELTSDAPANTVDHGLIRDVLLNPEAYKDFLIKAYEEAWSDGIITEDELEDLKKFQAVLGISDEDAKAISAKAKNSSSDE